MNLAPAISSKKIGRPTKPKDQVLGVQVHTSLSYPLHRDVMAEAHAAGYSRPEFLRMLIKYGLAAWRASESDLVRDAAQQALAALEASSTTKDYDATG